MPLSLCIELFEDHAVRFGQEHLIFFGEHSLRRALAEYIDHFHQNGIIRTKGTSFCFQHHADRSIAAAGELCNAKNDSVAYCDTTRPEQHEYWLGLLF